jgi:hypothetical protein
MIRVAVQVGALAGMARDAVRGVKTIGSRQLHKFRKILASDPAESEPRRND